MDDEFELYKARAYGRHKPFETQQDTQPSLQYTPQKPHHQKRSKHPRRSRFKPAATEVVACNEKIVDENKRRRHSAMGVTELSHQRRNLLPCAQFLPLDEESHLEEVSVARRKSDQPSSIYSEKISPLQFQKLQIKSQKSANQFLRRQERIEDIPCEEEEENTNFRTSKVNFAENLKEERDDYKKEDLAKPVGGANKAIHIDEIKSDKKNRRLSCENIRTNKTDGEHKRRFSAKSRTSPQTEASKREFRDQYFEAKSAENLKKMNSGRVVDNKYPRAKNSRQVTHDVTPRQQKPANKLRRSSMFVVPESHSSTHNLSVNKTPNKSSILFVSPTTHRRNSANRSRPSLSPPVSSLNHLPSARRNSAITYLTDVSPSRSKASLLSHGEDGWKPKEPLSTSPAENEEDENVENGEKEVTLVNILVVGLNGVGKYTLINQLLTAEYLANKNASDPDLNSDTKTSTAVFLEGQSYVVTFSKSTNLDDDQLDDTDACIVTYAVNDRSSFHKAVAFLQTIRKRFSNKRMFVVLTANKQDLVRNRLVQFKEGKKASVANRCKFMEVSALLDHKVDKLLENIIKGFIIRKERLKINVNGVKVEEDDFGDEDSDNDPTDGEDYEGGKTRNGLGKNCLTVFFRSVVSCLS